MCTSLDYSAQPPRGKAVVVFVNDTAVQLPNQAINVHRIAGRINKNHGRHILLTRKNIDAYAIR